MTKVYILSSAQNVLSVRSRSTMYILY